VGFRRAAVNFVIKSILTILCRIDSSEFYEALSSNKPMLVIFNHVNFLEVAIIATHSYPIYVSGLVKSETWKNPIFAFIFNTYKGIPIDRVGAFSESFKRVHEAIDNGFYVFISPEGTRSKDGILGKGKAGIIQLAMEANIPILPVAHHGGENIWRNIRRLRRTPFEFKAGRPFRIRYDGKPGRDDREKIMTEVMGQIASLLPEQKRGIYSPHINCEYKYLDFL